MINNQKAKLLPETNVSKFETIDAWHAKDDQSVWRSIDELIEGADPSSFSVISGYYNNYSKDNSNVYFLGKSLQGADPESFSPLKVDGYYAKDKNHIWYKGKILEGGQAESFQFFEDDRYAKDAKFVWYSGTNIPNADPDTFEVIGLEFAKDKNSIWIGVKQIANGDTNSLKIVHSSNGKRRYAVDKERAWKNAEQIEGADPGSFRVECVEDQSTNSSETTPVGYQPQKPLFKYTVLDSNKVYEVFKTEQIDRN